MIKKIFLTVLILLVVLIGALIAIPYFFKDEIVAVVTEEINKNVNAEVKFTDVDLSLIRSFPDFSLGLSQLTVAGIEEFEGITLAEIGNLGITLDVMSVINAATEPVQIKSVNLDTPKLHIVVLPSGQANYDIAKASTSTPAEETEATPMQISLQQYGINNANLIYDDRQGDMYLEINELNHSGKGDFTLDVFDLETETSIDAMTFKMEGIPYLKKAKANLDAGFNIDLPNSKYTLKENSLTVNAMQVQADGWVAMPSDDIEMDLSFNAPQNSFKNLLSLIPNAFTAGYEDVKADGNFTFNGAAKGMYSSTPERYPAFHMNLDIEDADIKYPDLPVGISDIFTKIAVNSPSADLDKMVVDISKFNLKMGNNPIDGYFKLKTPMSDPDLDTKIKGVLNLEELGKAFPMEGVKELSGVIDADVLVKTKMSTIDKEDYENVTMAGAMKANNLNYVAEDMPSILVKKLQTTFSPQAVEVTDFDAQLGKSDLKANGRLDNLLAYFSPEKTMTGSFKVRSNYFDANEWMTEETAAPATPAPEAVATTEAAEVFDRFVFDVDAQMKKIDYDIYDIKNMVAVGELSPDELTIKQFRTEIGNSDIAGNGAITNIFDYVFDNETLGGELNLSSKFFDLNQFMVEEATETPPTDEAELEPILVPDNIDMTINANFDKVRYTNMDLNKIKGKLVVADAAVDIKDMTSQTLGGQLGLSGGYDTKNPEAPVFDLAYNLKNLDFAEAFNTLNTFKAIAPLGQYIDGKMSSTLKMSSELGKDFMPKLSTLFADGFLNTFDAKIKNFPPLEALANKLDIRELKNLAIKNSKNWFKVEDGKVSVQPFDYEYEDIAMNIVGSYLLDGGMDFKIVAKVPREKIGKNSVGAAANKGLDLLSGQASKLGLNLDAGEFVNVQINLTGSMTDPKVGLNLLGTSGKNDSLKDAVAATVKEEANKKAEEAKAKAQEKVDEEVAKATEKVEEVKEEVTEKVNEELEKATEQVSEEVGKKAEEEFGKALDGKTGEAADKLKEGLGGLFGKKKKKDKEKEGN